jgi:hypothetical protein
MGKASQVALLAAVALAACSGEADEPAGERPPNLVMVVLDTLRADHLGLYG